VTAVIQASESMSGPPSEDEVARALGVGRSTYDTTGNVATTSALAISAVVLLTVMSSGGSASRESSPRNGSSSESNAQTSKAPEQDSESSRDTTSQGSLDSISAKGIAKIDVDRESWGDRSATWRLLGGQRIHAVLERAHEWVSAWSTVLARVLVDGQSMRAILGTLQLVPAVAGALVGGVAGFSIDGVVSPSFAWVVAIICLAMFDALSGAAAWLVFAVVAVSRFGVSGWFDVRTLLGMAVLFLGLPLIANSVRPLRRTQAEGLASIDRLADYLLGPLLVGIAAGGVYLALNGLSGLHLVQQSESERLRWVAGIAVIARMVVEDIAVRAYPKRMKDVMFTRARETPLAIDIGTILMKCCLFLLVASSFFGFGWSTWMVIVAMSLVPSLGLFSDRFPNSTTVHHWFPRGVLRSVIMLFIGVWFAKWILGDDTSAEHAKNLAAALMIPGVAVGVVDLFGRRGGEWPDRLTKRVIGGCLWAFMLAVMLGFVTV